MTVASSMLYIDAKGRWVSGRAPVVGDTIRHRVTKTWANVWWFYANQIDYARCLMAILAIVLTLHAPEWRYSIATLVMGSVLLDWVDGPVARAYGQSTVMGCGWDWLADLLAQYALAVWCMQVGTPITTFVVLFTIVEVATGLFDFAVSATAVYPEQSDTSKSPWYTIVEHWLTPNQSYNNLGIICWLVNTAYPISYCLGMNYWISTAMMPFAVLYAWHEVAQFIFIVQNWQETTATLYSGVDYMRPCAKEEVSRLQTCLEQVKEVGFPTGTRYGQAAGSDAASRSREITWCNLYNNGRMGIEYPLRSEMHQWVQQLCREMYNGEERYILSYGFIKSPAHGGVSQAWHFDYAPTVSNLFVPMTPTTVRNATEFVRGAIKTKMPESNYFPEPHHMLDAEGTDHLEICQVVSKPFVILKLFPAIMHHGIANEEDYDRLLFFVSTNNEYLDIGEEATGQLADKNIGDITPDHVLQQS